MLQVRAYRDTRAADTTMECFPLLNDANGDAIPDERYSRHKAYWTSTNLRIVSALIATLNEKTTYD